MPLKGLQALREFDARTPALLAQVESGDAAKAVERILREHRAAMEAYATDLAALFAWWIEAGSRAPHRFAPQQVEDALGKTLLGAYVPPIVEIHIPFDELIEGTTGLQVIREVHAPPKGSRARLVSGQAPGEPGVYDWTTPEGSALLAAALATREPSRAAQILSALPVDIQVHALLSLSRIVVPDSEAARGLPGPAIELLLGEARLKLSGMEHASAILNCLRTPTVEGILRAVSERAPEVANELGKHRFVFETLVSANDRGLQNLLGQVNESCVALALKSASEGLRQKLLRNVSRNVREQIQDGIRFMGPVRLADVERAQDEIITIAKRLRDQGDLVVALPGESPVVE